MTQAVVNLDIFEEFKLRFPPGHSKDSSSYPISQALYALVRLIQPSHVVEVGTFEGASSIWLARAVAENSRGSYTGYEVNREGAAKTRESLAAAVPGGPWLVKGMDVLAEPYIETDFLFLDCEKTTYGPAFAKCLVPVNGYVVAHDTAAWPAAIHFYRFMKILPEYEVVNLHSELGLMVARKIA